MILKKVLSPVSDALDRVCSVAIVLMLGLMVIITTAQIICRTFFGGLPKEVEEAAIIDGMNDAMRATGAVMERLVGKQTGLFTHDGQDRSPPFGF